jgi:oligopeptide transport system substrate-binding protein
MVLRRLRRWSLFLAGGLLLSLLSGCSREFRRADLVFLNGAEPETLDPALITGQPEGRIVYALFEGLTHFNAAGEAVPGVAERWEISPDGRVYTFHLRPDARWSNGDPVTAADFVASWRRVLLPETGADYASQLYYIRNAREFNEGKFTDFSQVGVRALSPRVLEVTLVNPTSFFLDLCAFATLAPVHLPTVEKYGDDWVKPGKLVGNGAFTLQEWRINDRLRLAKSPTYWNRDHVGMKTVDALPTSSATTAFNFYSTGQVDLVIDKGLVPNMILDDLKKRRDFHTAPFLATYFLRFNVTKPPYNDPRVRKAISMVIDKKLLVDKITRAGEPPAGGIVPPGTGGNYDSPPGLPYNPEKARALLAEAGFPGGRGFPLVHYLYNSSDANEAIAVELKEMLKRDLGIELDLQRQEWKTYLRAMSAMEYDICRGSWVGDYNDPNTFLGIFVTGDGNNRTGWSNATYDALIDEAAREPDPDKRFAIFRKAEELLITGDSPIFPLYYFVGIQFYDSTRLGGVQANLLDEHPISEMYWKTGEGGGRP